MKFFNHKIYLFTGVGIIALIFIIYPFVFSYASISGGDYTYVANSYLTYLFNNSFSSWISTYNFGQNTTALLNYAPYNFLIGFMASFVNWSGILIERIFWWIPFFALAFFAHFYARRLLPLSKTGFLSTFIFLFNTYTLMLLGGGQISGVGLAYVVSPIVLVTFIELINDSSLKITEKGDYRVLFKKSIIAALFLSVQVVFDLRFAYIMLCAVFVYALLKIVQTISQKNAYAIAGFILFYSLIIPLAITALLHSFWLLPTIIFHQNPIAQLGPGYNSIKAVKYFSFAKFENTLSLLHPNWPENMFGFVHFMRPEFLVLPILAYASLLFIKKPKSDAQNPMQIQNSEIQKNVTSKQFNNRYILFFALLGLAGAFLAKGANDPFGGLYLWMFQHVPGFFMFRDPTKWYMLLVISYSVLIPFTVWKMYEWLWEKLQLKNQSTKVQFKIQKYIPSFFIILFFVFWLFTIRQALIGQLTGTFKPQPISQEYIQLNSFISSQPSYFRTLWFPTRQKYGIYSIDHPAISANEFFNKNAPKDLVNKISDRKTQMLLQNSSIRYIIIPDDTDGTIYLTDRKYDRRQYEFYINSLEKISWLKEKTSFGNNKVFELVNSKNHFWSPDTSLQIYATEINPTKYTVTLNSVKRGQLLVFSEKYDPGWQAKVANEKMQSQNFNGLNSFVLPKDGNYLLVVTYVPQVWVYRGLIISAITFVLLLGSLFILKRNTK